jgi:hypothetical protein
MLHGFDVSAFQSAIVPPGDFIFVKATEGKGYTSSKFDAQWADAKKKSIIRGAYHFARPEESSAVSQADRLLAKAKAGLGELLCLDLEASKLNQAQTNAWAKAFGDRLREKAPLVVTVLYMGSGYATSNTGRDLSKHFDLWWYPQYPSAKATKTWPTKFSPWLPSGNTTGWDKPHIWQWTSAYGGLYDANVAWIPVAQLVAALADGQNQEVDMPYGGELPAKANVPNGVSKKNISFPKGSEGAIGLVYDNLTQAEVRVAFHHSTGGGMVKTVKVGGPKSATDTWPAKVVVTFDKKADGDWVSLTRNDSGTDPVGWDMS